MAPTVGSAEPIVLSKLSASIYAELEKIYSDNENGADSARMTVYGIMQQGDVSNTLRWAEELYKLGRKYDDDATRSYGAAMMGGSYIYLRNADSSRLYLKEAVELGEKAGFDWGLGSAYNGLGLYALNFEDFDTYQAIRYFRAGLEPAKRSKNINVAAVLLSNIANAYYLKGDTTGLSYALESYEMALETGDDYLIFTAAHEASAIYFLKKDYANALKYVKISEASMTSKSEDQISPHKAIIVYTLYGRTLTALGDYTGAKHYFELALSFRDATVSDELVLTYLDYGDYYKQLGQWRQALSMYLVGMELSEEMLNEVYHNFFYLRISEAYEAVGDHVEAMRYYKEYYQLSQKQFNVEKERSLNEMRVQYDLEKKEAEIEMAKLRLIQEERKTQILWVIVLAVLLGFAGTVYFYRRRNKLYLEIVKQSQKAVKAKEKLRRGPLQGKEFVAMEPEDEEEVEKYANSPLSSARSMELFERLEQIMETEKAYRDGDLNIDKLAERMGSNRSYLSRIINEFSGLNFNNYVNKYRIEEAVNILSDTNNNIPLKALAAELGFNNLTTFYNSFQKEQGIPPSQYRKKVIELER
jgi:AraC-like DNA-binding protein